MKDRWSQLSLKDKSDLMSLYIRNGISSLEEIKKHYNSYQDGGRVDSPPIDPILKGRQPKANFYQRLLNPFRQTMPDWENRINGKNRVATHKLSWVTDDNGNAIVYPNVQEINDKLYDFTDPRNKAKKWDALDRAIQTGDTIQMTPAQANFWTQHYKEFYPSFNYATGGQMNNGGPDEPPEEISYKRQLLPVNIYNDDAQAWLQDWLSNRKTQLRDNYLASRSPFRKVKDWFIGNKHYGIENNVLAAQLEGMNRMSQIISDNPEEVYAEGNPDYSVYNDSYIDWLTGHTHGETFHKSDKIYYNPIEEITTIEYDDRDPREEDISTNNIIINKTLEDIPMSTRIHENTHALADYYNDKNRLSPQEKIIYNKYAHYLNEKDESLLHPSEIYSRIMSLRYNTGLKPTDKVDKKWLENNEKFIKDLHLDFRKDKLIDLLNEVAYNYNPEVLKLS